MFLREKIDQLKKSVITCESTNVYTTILSFLPWNGKKCHFAKYLCSMTINTLLKLFFCFWKIEKIDFGILLWGHQYIYIELRSPSSTEANNQELYHKLYNLISCEHVNTFDKVCIVGDFNFPTVKWNWEWSGIKDNMFLECIRDAFSTRMVSKPTRRREEQTTNLLDFVLVSEESSLRQNPFKPNCKKWPWCFIFAVHI